jgi:hypothetical protein
VAEGHIEIVDCEILSIDYGGGAPARVSPWDALSDTCKDALKKAVPVKNGVNGIPFWLAALKRANDAKDMLMKAADAKGIAWELLAAIGVRDVPISFCRVPLLVLSGHKKGTNPADCQSEEVEGGVASKVHTADFARTHSFGSRRQDLSPCWAVSDVTDRWRHWRVQELVLV